MTQRPLRHGDDSGLRIFISYSRDDVAIADQIDATLLIGGYQPQIDRKGIEVGEDWAQRLKALIRGADVLLVLLSPSWAHSDACRTELEWALEDGKRIVPVLCRPLGDAQPHAALASLNYIYLYAEPRKPGTGFGAGLLELHGALNVDLDWLREHTRLLQRAGEWQAAGRPAIRLLSGADVEAAKEWAARQPPEAGPPTALHLSFIRASEEEEARRQNTERQRLQEMAAAQAERESALAAKEQAQAREALARVGEAQQARRVLQRTVAGLVLALGLAAVATWFGLSAQRQRESAERALRQVRANATAWIDALAAQRAEVLAAATSASPAGAPDAPAAARAADEAERALASGALAQARATAQDGLLLVGDVVAAAPRDQAPGLVALRLHRVRGIAAARQGGPAARVAQAALADALALADQLDARHPGDAALREALARALLDVGDYAVQRIPQPDDDAQAGVESPALLAARAAAAQPLQRLLALRSRQLAESGQSPAAGVAVAIALNSLARYEIASRRPGPAGAFADAALALLDTLPPATPARDRERSIAYHQAAESRAGAQRFQEAVDLIDQDIQISRRLAAATPDSATRLHSLATSLSKQAAWQTALGQAVRAIALLDDADAQLRQAIAQAGQSRPDWLRDRAGVLEQKAILLDDAEQPRAAEQARRDSLALREQGIEIAGGAAWQGELEETWRTTRRTLLKLQRTQDALAAADQQLFATALAPCFEDQAAQCGAERRAGDVAEALSQFAWTALLAGRPDRALWATERARVLDPASHSVRLNHAHALMLAGAPGRAVQAHRTAIAADAAGAAAWTQAACDDIGALRQQGIHAGAMDELQRLLTCEPNKRTPR